MKTLTIIALLIFAIYNIAIIRKFGIQPSYSETHYRCKDAGWGFGHNLSLMQAVTAITAFLLVPPLIQAGEGNPAQCLGFLAPAYLMVVAAFPNFHDSLKEQTIHTVSAIVAAVAIILWLIAIRHQWYVLLAFTLVFGGLGYATKTLKGNITFYGEMILFVSAMVSLIL